jgi:elongator complex protein 1
LALTSPAYTLASKPEKSLKAYEKAHAWRQLFASALQQNLSRESIVEMCERVAGESSQRQVFPEAVDRPDHLASRGKSLEAAQIHVEYGKDVDSAVNVLCKGTEFAEAYRLVSFDGPSRERAAADDIPGYFA